MHRRSREIPVNRKELVAAVAVPVHLYVWFHLAVGDPVGDAVGHRVGHGVGRAEQVGGTPKGRPPAGCGGRPFGSLTGLLVGGVLERAAGGELHRVGGSDLDGGASCRVAAFTSGALAHR